MSDRAHYCSWDCGQPVLFPGQCSACRDWERNYVKLVEREDKIVSAMVASSPCKDRKRRVRRHAKRVERRRQRIAQRRQQEVAA